MKKHVAGAVAGLLVAVGGLAVVSTPAHAARPARAVAYVRSGDIFVLRGKTERRLTRGGGNARPSWSPDGRRIAYLHAGRLYVMKANGKNKRQLTTVPAGGPSWSPDGRWIAFAARGCIGGPAVYRVDARRRGASSRQPTALFPAECRGAAPRDDGGEAPVARGAKLADRLRFDDALDWSPDGTRIAFRGGDCENVFDDCLTIGTVATGAERLLAGYGGGGQEASGFAVLPAWRPDGRAISWTSYRRGPTGASSEPLHVVQQDLRTGSRRWLGVATDRELAYENSVRAVLTGRHRGGSWVIAVNLSTGRRTPLRPGSQPDISPVT